MGRKKLDAEIRKGISMAIRVTPSQREKLERIADSIQRKGDLSDGMRLLIDRYGGRLLEQLRKNKEKTPKPAEAVA